MWCITVYVRKTGAFRSFAHRACSSATPWDASRRPSTNWSLVSLSLARAKALSHPPPLSLSLPRPPTPTPPSLPPSHSPLPLPLSRPSVTHSNQHTWWLSVSVTVEEFDNELALNPSRVRPMMAALGDMYVDTYRHPPPPNACGSRPYTLGPRPYTLHPRP